MVMAQGVITTMSTEAKNEKTAIRTTAVTELDAPRGFLPAVATLAVDTGEIAATTALGLTTDVRTELAKSAIVALDAGEALIKSGFSVARRLTQRIDGAFADVVASLEKIVGTSASAARTTTKDAAQVLSGAVNAVVAPKGN
jgi:hypothetical protein